jgi:hypothetical protein
LGLFFLFGGGNQLNQLGDLPYREKWQMVGKDGSLNMILAMSLV